MDLGHAEGGGGGWLGPWVSHQLADSMCKNELQPRELSVEKYRRSKSHAMLAAQSVWTHAEQPVETGRRQEVGMNRK